ncbi:hypothetical protein [Halorubrum sp. HHNYT27]|uniref:hypothetical protein n=1 Tax=Halorubrum sp. HHNYT27 TaxID=3402275 RepID=UPI003EB9986C
MRSIVEILPEAIELVAVSLGSVGLSVAGLFIERFALASAQSSQTVLAGWAAGIGCVVLLSAYFLATDRVADGLRELRRDVLDSVE